MLGLILLLLLGTLVAVTLAAAGTRARADHPTGGRDRRRGVQLILGMVAYPAASVLVLHGLSGSAIDAASITVFASPGLAFGALVRRIWIVGVPPAGAVIWLLVAHRAGARMAPEGHLWRLRLPEAAPQCASTVAEDRFAV